MPMKVFKMMLLFSVVLFSYTFPFYFSLPFLFSILPVLQCFFCWHPCLVCPLPYSSFPFTTPQNLAAVDIITSYHSLLWSSTKLLLNILISMSQDKPEVIYCCCAHGPVEFHLTLKGTLLFKLLEVSLCNLWWRSDMESPYASDCSKGLQNIY